MFRHVRLHCVLSCENVESCLLSGVKRPEPTSLVSLPQSRLRMYQYLQCTPNKTGVGMEKTVETGHTLTHADMEAHHLRTTFFSTMAPGTASFTGSRPEPTAMDSQTLNRPEAALALELRPHGRVPSAKALAAISMSSATFKCTPQASSSRKKMWDSHGVPNP